MRSASLSARLLVACLAAGFALPACADLYGFVDADGKVHLAREKLDGRYELFVKGELRRDFEPEPEPAELKFLPATDSLRDHVIYRRLQKTPNVDKYEPLVLREAERHRLEPALVKAVIAVESAYDPQAVSSKGAVGLMQLIPGTAERYGVKKIADPRENIAGGTRYLRDLIDMFEGNLKLALAAYNAGEGAVQKYGRNIPPYPETQSYVRLVMQFYEHFGGGEKKVRRAAARAPAGPAVLSLPGRRNLPPEGLHIPGLTRDRPATVIADTPDRM